MPQPFSHRFGFLLFVFAGPLGAATLDGWAGCSGIGDQQHGQFSCSGPLDSASAVFTSSAPGFVDLRVDAAAMKNPNGGLSVSSSAWMIYDGLFLLNVAGIGSGTILPIMTITYIGEPALTSEATATLGNIKFTGSSTNGFGGGTYSTADLCYFCRIPITFGQALPLELKLNAYSGTGFALFPSNVTSAQSRAGASLQDFWVFDSNGQRISNPSITFVEGVPTPEPGTFGVVLLALAWLGYRHRLNAPPSSRQSPSCRG